MVHVHATTSSRARQSHSDESPSSHRGNESYSEISPRPPFQNVSEQPQTLAHPFAPVSPFQFVPSGPSLHPQRDISPGHPRLTALPPTHPFCDLQRPAPTVASRLRPTSQSQLAPTQPRYRTNRRCGPWRKKAATCRATPSHLAQSGGVQG